MCSYNCKNKLIKMLLKYHVAKAFSTCNCACMLRFDLFTLFFFYAFCTVLYDPKKSKVWMFNSQNSIVQNI